MKILTTLALTAYAIPAVAFTDFATGPSGTPQFAPQVVHQNGQSNSYGSGVSKGSVDPLSVMNIPTAHGEMLERIAKRDAKRARRAKPSKPAFHSVGFSPPDSNGYRVSNPLGTVYCGLNGCWR